MIRLNSGSSTTLKITYPILMTSRFMQILSIGLMMICLFLSASSFRRRFLLAEFSAIRLEFCFGDGFIKYSPRISEWIDIEGKNQILYMLYQCSNLTAGTHCSGDPSATSAPAAPVRSNSHPGGLDFQQEQAPLFHPLTISLLPPTELQPLSPPRTVRTSHIQV